MATIWTVKFEGRTIGTGVGTLAQVNGQLKLKGLVLAHIDSETNTLRVERA